MYSGSYDSYECSMYDLYDLFPVVYDKIDAGEQLCTFIGVGRIEL